LLKPLERRRFAAIVAHCDGDARARIFGAWEHLSVMVFAQLSGARSLRELEAGWNAASQHHHHLGASEIARSTLADANRTRPAAVFADAFAWIAGLLDRATRRDGEAMLRLIDSTPIPLGKLCGWAKSNGRIRGLKMHVVYDPKADCPRILDITDANVNDAEIGRRVEIAAGATYVFDKGYVHYGWWRAIDAAKAVFVTRPKVNMGLACVAARPLGAREGDGFTVLSDEEARFSSKGGSKLPMRLRRVTLKRHADGGRLALLTNDLDRAAVDIAALYKDRWRIELLFRWIKQHLRIGKFMGNNDNAIRIQLIAAMIAYALVRIAARTHRVALPILRFLDLVALFLFERRDIAAIDRPPPVNPSRRRDRSSPEQYGFAFP
jgi:IS4 transposase